MTGLPPIDHIVMCVPILNDGIKHVERITGITPTIGGRHLDRGTHNAIFKIGPRSYFEILAPDPQNLSVTKDRWMGVDHVTGPTITRWALASPDIRIDAQRLSQVRGTPVPVSKGQRALSNGGSLQWQMTDPGVHPNIDLLPFLLDWQDSQHPSETLESFCTIVGIQLYHQDPHKIHDQLNIMGLTLPVMRSASARIAVELETSKGLIVL